MMEFDLSETNDPIEPFLRSRMLSAPSRPGLLASLDQFEIIGVMHQGPVCMLFRARDGNDGSGVVIKMLQPHLAADREARSTFLSAALRMQQMRHPGIIEVKAVAAAHSHAAFFVMPIMEMGALAGYAQGLDAFRAVELRRMFQQLAGALQYAHGQGILHGDIKPSNIFMASGSRMVLSDFGMHLMARYAPVKDPESGVAYESPAVAAGEEQDTRRDIYAIGAVLYYCLTGQPPFSGTTAEEVRSKILSGPPKPIRDVQPKADSSLARIAEKAMARELRHCFADSAELEEALEGKGKNLSGRKRFQRMLFPAFLLVATALTSFWLGAAFRRHQPVPRAAVQYVSESITANPGQPLIYPSLFPVPQLRVDGVEITKPGTSAEISLGWDHPEGYSTYTSLSSRITVPAQLEIILERSANGNEAPVEVGRFISPTIGEWVSPAPLEFKDRVEDPGVYSYQIKIRTQNAKMLVEHLRLKVELKKQE